MNPGLRAAATGMVAQQRRVEVIANNLANVNTTAFKRSRAHFEDLLYQMVQGSTTVGTGNGAATEAVQVGRGTRLSAVQRIDAQGAIEDTGRPLDIAIDGEGLLQVELPDGNTAYTRDGSLTIGEGGRLTTQGGYALQPSLIVPPDASQVMISRTGIVSVTTPKATAAIEIGRVELARFANAPGLQALGENLYRETAASGAPMLGYPQEDGFGRLLQGTLEASNVEVVQEMVDMISALRAYEVNSKAVKSAEEMSQTANDLIR
jgi:flagellar basal-body rod protein FlgG